MFSVNFLEVFKSTHFWVYFQLKVKFKLKNLVIQYKNIKKDTKKILCCVFNQKRIDEETKNLST